MTSNREKVLKGAQAKGLQREIEPIVQSMREEVFKQIQSSSFFQRRERENCYKMLRTIDLFENRLKRQIDNGKVAESKLKLAR
jgi:hypothetical protein